MKNKTSMLFAVILCLVGIVCSQQEAFTNQKHRITFENAYKVLIAARSIFTNNAKAIGKKSQAVIPANTPFPCDVSSGRSAIRPSSVHRLRPGDIDVIGAIGDSITSAFGARATEFAYMILAYRGVSFPVGGAETWRTVFTLPNILKVYNPNLVGYSRGICLSWNLPCSQFNVAEGSAISSDMPQQAAELVRRMRQDARVDFHNDWKMVTVYMGINDICSRNCYAKLEDVVENHRRDLMATLDILRDSMPRTLVNILPAADMGHMFSKYSFSSWCARCHKMMCSCLTDPAAFQNRSSLLEEITKQWQLADKQVTELARYQTKDDFAVVFQPFTMTVPDSVGEAVKARGKPRQNQDDYSPDCSHISQKMHARAASSMWNNLLQPVGSKSLAWSENLLDNFICPNKTHPYIFTANNSVGL